MSGHTSAPFPEELTYRMLSLTTVEGDVVLDPMAGIGSVPAMAEAMGRVGYGLELTAKYAELYDRTAESASRFLYRIGDDTSHREDFRRTIIRLRLLKFAKLVGQYITAAGLPVSWVRVQKSWRRPEPDFKVVSGDFELALADTSLGERALAVASSVSERPPLSKFGVDAKFAFVELASAARGGYWYASGRFWNAPGPEQPTGGEPHVVAGFAPDTDKIDDTPYA